MITNYYTLAALVAEWQHRVPDHELLEAFSQEPDEIHLALAGPDSESMLRVRTRPPMQFIFRVDGYAKARRNVATIFPQISGRKVEALTIANRDRMIFLHLDDGSRIQIVLFGPRANVLWVADDGTIQDAFLRSDQLTGTAAPQPRPAPRIESTEVFQSRWNPEAESLQQAIAAAFPLLDRDIAAEVAIRAGHRPNDAPALDRDNLQSILDAAVTIGAELQDPKPIIYWDEHEPRLFSLIELSSFEGLRAERFSSVDEAVRIFVRRTLVRRRFMSEYEPLERALVQAAMHHRRAADRMSDEIARPSRADLYERWGHLLMAQAHQVPPGANDVEVDDLFAGGRTRIPLDSGLSAVENAKAYYEKARVTRRSREEAQRRLDSVTKQADEVEHLLEELRSDVASLRELEAYRKRHAEELARILPDSRRQSDCIPFRRFKLPGGYEVWVGRNARQNDALTFHHAQKYDLWMHARGVPGSHAVLRKPNRDAEPSPQILEAAASIAAYFSKARGSNLVPVAITERKYVTKPRGAEPGAVRVEREQVLIVEPRLPD